MVDIVLEYYTEDDGTITQNCSIGECDFRQTFRAGDQYLFMPRFKEFCQHLFDAHGIDSVVMFK
jgi:capsule polysaccharide modification protein KpsS